jgi:hypothetical protein
LAYSEPEVGGDGEDLGAGDEEDGAGRDEVEEGTAGGVGEGAPSERRSGCEAEDPPEHLARDGLLYQRVSGDVLEAVAETTHRLCEGATASSGARPVATVPNSLASHATTSSVVTATEVLRIESPSDEEIMPKAEGGRDKPEGDASRRVTHPSGPHGNRRRRITRVSFGCR